MRINAHRHIADDVLVDACLPLKLLDHWTGSIDVEQDEVRLAVAVDLVGEGFEATGFGLCDFALIALDAFGGLRRKRVNLGRTEVLTRKANILLKRHVPVPFPRPNAYLSPTEPKSGR